MQPEVEDRTVIRAVVQARLLGIRLLTLDARVVLGKAGDRAWPDPQQGALSPALYAPPALAPWPTVSSSDGTGSIAQAVAMLSDSRRTLERTR